MYRVSIELQKHEWKFGRTRNAVFPQLFRVFQNFHECFFNTKETQRTVMLSIPLRKHHEEKKENNLLALIIKM